jgi:hypothetical protein
VRDVRYLYIYNGNYYRLVNDRQICCLDSFYPGLAVVGKCTLNRLTTAAIYNFLFIPRRCGETLTLIDTVQPASGPCVCIRQDPGS